MARSTFPQSQRRALGLGPAFSVKMGFDFVQIMRKSFATGLHATSDEVLSEARQFYAALNEYKAGKGGSRSLASANSRIADAAQQAVLASYDERVTNAPGRLASYRIGDNRYSGGALRRALAHPAMFEGSYSGITFMNVAILDREAAHWARLNWGAGERAGEGGPGPFVRFTVFGQVLGTPFRPASFPQPGFKMPPGLWVGKEWKNSGEGGKRAGSHTIRWGDSVPGFYPISKSKAFSRQTKGIAARRFFDAAYVEIARTLPIEYQNLLHEWNDQASRTFKGLAYRAQRRAAAGA